MFGRQLGFTIKTIKNWQHLKRTTKGPVLGGGAKKDLVKVIMQVVISLIALISGIYIIIYVNDPAAKHLASGWTGLVIGYWLR